MGSENHGLQRKCRNCIGRIGLQCVFDNHQYTDFLFSTDIIQIQIEQDGRNDLSLHVRNIPCFCGAHRIKCILPGEFTNVRRLIQHR